MLILYPVAQASSYEWRARAHLPSPLGTRAQPLLALTSLRFFAAFWVILFHYGQVLDGAGLGMNFIGRVRQSGYIAVDLFYVLSGFILFYNYRDNVRDASQRRGFWGARLARIYPAYLLAFVVAAPFAIAGTLQKNGWFVGAGKLAVGGAPI